MKKEMTNKSLTKKQNVKTPHESHRRSEEARPIVKINRPTGRSVVVPVVSMETRIMCTYVYYTVVLVPGDPLLVNVETAISDVCYISSALPSD